MPILRAFWPGDSLVVGTGQNTLTITYAGVNVPTERVTEVKAAAAKANFPIVDASQVGPASAPTVEQRLAALEGLFTGAGGGVDAELIRDTIAAALRAGTGIAVTVDDPGNTITIGLTGGAAADPELVRDTIGVAMRGAGGATISVDDAGDTITVTSKNRLSTLDDLTASGAAPGGVPTATQVTNPGQPGAEVTEWKIRPPLKVIGSTTVGFGDSNMGWADVTNTQRAAQEGSWFSKACFLSGQRMRYLRNSGIAGNTTAQMLARIDTDVIAYRPAKCVVLGGTNDVGTSVPAATTRTNLTEIIDRLVAAGIEPILCTIPPYNDAARREPIAKLNAWITAFAARRGVHVLDFAAVLTDPATGLYRSGYSVDAAHMSETGQKAVADYVAMNLPRSFAEGRPFLTYQRTDLANLLTNGLFHDTNSDGDADSWTIAGGTSSTRRIIAGTGSVIGNWQEIENTGSQWSYLSQTVAAGGSTFTVGDRISFAARVQLDNTADAMNPNIRIGFTGSTGLMSLDPIAFWKRNFADGICYGEAIVPPGTTALQVLLSTNNGLGKLRVAQATLLNMTALALPGAGFDEPRSAVGYPTAPAV